MARPCRPAREVMKKNREDVRYLQFPLYLAGEVHKDKRKTLNNIISYGIMRFFYSKGTGDVEEAKDYLRIKGGDQKSDEAVYREVEEKRRVLEDKYGGQPMPTLEKHLAFEFRDDGSHSPELIAAVIAVRSIIGPKKWTATTKATIAARMIGAKSNEALNDLLKDDVLRAVYDKFRKRYHIDRMLSLLVERGFLQSEMPNGRRICISTSLSTEELEEILISREERNAHEARRSAAMQRIKEARQRARENKTVANGSDGKG